MKFLDGLDDDLKKNLLDQLRVLWTHTSTALEGNTLTLGETAFVLGEGLTIQGKPLKDHRDVEGHARAVDLMYDLVKKDQIAAGDLFNLHKLVIDEQILDFFKPVGDWKKENNSTPVTVGGRQIILKYSDYWEVPKLMERWLEMLHNEMQVPKESEELVRSYARLHVSFVAIHPFYDGNGRVARLAANLPCLNPGSRPSSFRRKGVTTISRRWQTTRGRTALQPQDPAHSRGRRFRGVLLSMPGKLAGNALPGRTGPGFAADPK